MELIFENPELILYALFLIAIVRAGRPVYRSGGRGDDEGSSLLVIFLVIIFLVGGLTFIGNSAGISDFLPNIEAKSSNFATTDTSYKESADTLVPIIQTRTDHFNGVKEERIKDTRTNKDAELANWGDKSLPDTPPHGHPTDADFESKPYTEFMLRIDLYTVNAYAEDRLKTLEQHYSNAIMVTTIDNHHHVGLGPFTSKAEAKTVQRHLKLDTYLISFDYP